PLQGSEGARKPIQADKVALIQPHERDKAARLGAPGDWCQGVVQYHYASTITQAGDCASRTGPEFRSCLGQSWAVAREPAALASFVLPYPRVVQKNSSRPQPPLDAGRVENAAGDLLDGAFRGVERGDGVARKHRFRRADLVGDLLARGVATFRAALGADLLQALGLDGQGIKFATVRLEAGR